MNIERKDLKLLLAVAVILIAGIGIGYAALSTTMTITFGNVSQSALTWNVGFTGTTATATEAGTSTTGRVCGTATITATAVTIADSQLSKPGDKCTYALTVKNSGTIPAKLNTITPTAPSSITCNPSSGGNMVCGNITYKLTTDAAGTTTLTTGGTLNANDTLPLYLVVSYTGNDVNSSAVVQSGATFALTYDQA